MKELASCPSIRRRLRVRSRMSDLPAAFASVCSRRSARHGFAEVLSSAKLLEAAGSGVERRGARPRLIAGVQEGHWRPRVSENRAFDGAADELVGDG